MRFDQGRVLRRRFWFGGALLQVYPVRVVDHTDDGLLLWLPSGAPMWRAELPDGRQLRDIPRETWPERGFPLRKDRWRHNGTLIFQPRDADTHSVWWLFSATGRFERWYVNLERRSLHGADVGPWLRKAAVEAVHAGAGWGNSWPPAVAISQQPAARCDHIGLMAMRGVEA